MVLSDTDKKIKLNEYKKNWAKEHEASRKLSGKKYYDTHKEKSKLYAVKYKERRMEQVLPEYNWKIKLEVFTYYSKGFPVCACCGECILFFLTLDHINGGGAKERKEYSTARGGISFYKALKNKGYPEGYQVLCYNCNCAKGTKEFCPHKLLE